MPDQRSQSSQWSKSSQRNGQILELVTPILPAISSFFSALTLRKTKNDYSSAERRRISIPKPSENGIFEENSVSSVLE